MTIYRYLLVQCNACFANLLIWGLAYLHYNNRMQAIQPLIPIQLLSADTIQNHEQFSTLLQGRHFELVRIHSPAEFVSQEFSQDEDEFVVLMQGKALLELVGRELLLDTGEGILIPAHTPHRVLKTSRNPQCIWVALHFKG